MMASQENASASPFAFSRPGGPQPASFGFRIEMRLIPVRRVPQVTLGTSSKPRLLPDVAPKFPDFL